MNKIAILSSTLLALWIIYQNFDLSTKTQLEIDFGNFITIYKKSYSSESEYLFRLEIFRRNMESASRLSDLNPHAEFGVTKFADQTEDEMLQRMGDFPDELDGLVVYSYDFPEIPNEQHDWRPHQQAVQDQGNCGSCWAFAATATIETYMSILRQDKVKLSEQQLVD